MRLPLSALRRLIREELDLGDVVFSPRRVDGVPKNEPDTADEAALFRDLAKWVRGEPDTRGVYTGLGDRLRDLLYSSKYSDFFRSPPPDTVIYRGMHGVPVSQLSGWLSRDPKSAAAFRAMMDGDRGWQPCRFTLAPRKHGMTSWSTEEDTAASSFAAASYPMESATGVVFRARAAGARDAVDLSSIQAAVPDLSPGWDESEVLVLGPVVVDGVRMVDPPETED